MKEMKQYENMLEGVTPCVIGKTATGYVTVVTKNEMNDCNGDAKRIRKPNYPKITKPVV